MKKNKIYAMLAALLATTGLQAQDGNLLFVTPDTQIDYQISSVSPNGKWACGNIDDGNLRGFLWNLTSGEIKELSLPGDVTYVLSVSDEGIVAGAHRATANTPNHVPLETAAYYKDGQWHTLGLTNPNNDIQLIYGTNNGQDGSGANAISNDGRFIAGIGYAADQDYYPVIWDNGVPNIIENMSGSIYDISDDGNVACGWTIHPRTKNRTCCIWRKGDDGKYVKTNTDLKSPWSSGPFCTARGISPNARYVVCYNRVWDLKTDKYVEHDFRDAAGGFELYGVTNDGTVYGYVNDGSQGGASAVLIGRDKMRQNLAEYFKDNGVDLSHYPMLLNTVSVSGDGNTYGIYGIDEEGTPRSIVVKLNVDTLTMAPVALETRALPGVNAEVLTWNSPLKNVAAISGYNVYRNGTKLNSELLTSCKFIDKAIADGDYQYTVTAVYNNGAESSQSEASMAHVQPLALPQARQLFAIPSSRNDARLYWDHAAVNTPAMGYYNDGEEIAGIGGGAFSLEGAIRLSQEELKIYQEQNYQLTDITFVPGSKQKSWTLNIYAADNDDAPIFTEQIDAEGLIYGQENNYTLKQPLTIPAGQDLIMSILAEVEGNSNFNVLGMVYKKSIPGYSDLIRQKGEKDFYSLHDAALSSPNGAYEYNICWALRAHFSPMGEQKNAIKQYLIKANDQTVGTTTDKKFRVENLADGKYEFQVIAEYENGKYSAPTTAELEIQANDNVYKTVTPKVSTYGYNAELTWEAPKDDDATMISYGTGNFKGGLVGTAENQYSYMVATEFNKQKMQNFEDFEITGFSFYPLAEADFTFYLKVDDQEVCDLPVETGKDYQLNKWNTVKLETPIRINRYSKYTLMLDCYDVTPEKAPVGMDDQPAYPYLSDLYSEDDGDTFKSAAAQIDGATNWMIGLEVAACEPKVLPVKGYNVYLLNQKQNETPINDLHYTFNELELKTYQARVNPVYENEAIGEKRSPAVTFVIDVTGIEDLSDTTWKVAQDATTIRVEGADIQHLQLYNTQGALVAESNDSSLSVVNLVKGTYILKIQNGQQVITTKIYLTK